MSYAQLLPYADSCDHLSSVYYAAAPQAGGAVPGYPTGYYATAPAGMQVQGYPPGYSYAPPPPPPGGGYAAASAPPGYPPGTVVYMMAPGGYYPPPPPGGQPGYPPGQQMAYAPSGPMTAPAPMSAQPGVVPPRKVAFFNARAQRYITVEHGTLTCHQEIDNRTNFFGVHGQSRAHKGHFIIDDHGTHQMIRSYDGRFLRCNALGLISTGDMMNHADAKFFIDVHMEHGGKITLKTSHKQYIGIRSSKVVASREMTESEYFQLEDIHS